MYTPATSQLGAEGCLVAVIFEESPRIRRSGSPAWHAVIEAQPDLRRLHAAFCRMLAMQMLIPAECWRAGLKSRSPEFDSAFTSSFTFSPFPTFNNFPVYLLSPPSRRQNNFKNGIYPSSVEFLAGILVIVLVSRFIFGVDTSLGLINWLDGHVIEP